MKKRRRPKRAKYKPPLARLPACPLCGESPIPEIEMLPQDYGRGQWIIVCKCVSIHDHCLMVRAPTQAKVELSWRILARGPRYGT